jgi:hypothetical protein
VHSDPTGDFPHELLRHELPEAQSSSTSHALAQRAPLQR